MKPTDDELEAMAVKFSQAAELSYFLSDDYYRQSAAMLRACKGWVRVKPLLWDQARDGAGWHPQLTIAYCPIFDKRFYAEHPEKQAKIGAAREARILSALEPAPDYLEGWNDAREAAAKVCDEKGAAEQVNYKLNRGTQNYFRARDAIRALTPPERPDQ